MSEQSNASVESVSLKDLMVPEKVVDIEFPGLDGFILKISHLGRAMGAKLSKKSTKKTWVNHQPVEEFDSEKFIPEFCKSVIKGWTGLKYKYLEELLLVDIGDKDPESELLYSLENAVMLLENSVGFDEWITEVSKDLSNFTKDK
jgi:hypothetical protein